MTPGLLRFYRALLRLYPAQFRQEFEHEILQLFQNEWAWQRSPFARAAFLFTAAAPSPSAPTSRNPGTIWETP